MWIDHDNDLVDLTIGWTKHTKKGDVHEDETIHTNQKHPFLTVEAGFVPVSNLHVGMHLVEGNRQIAIIEDWLVIAGSQTMYNLTIQQDHTYTVGDGQFVVHNVNCNSAAKDLAWKWVRTLRTLGKQTGEDYMDHTTIGVAFREDGIALIAKNENWLEEGASSSEDVTASVLKQLIEKQDGMQYVGPTQLVDSASDAQHAEMFLFQTGEDLKGIGTATRDMCGPCRQAIQSVFPSLIN